MESIKNLGMAVGKEAVALVKAPWVMLMTESSDIRLSARNCLEGKVAERHRWRGQRRSGHRAGRRYRRFIRS